MTKRHFVILAVCVLSLTCVFASHSVSVQACPYAVQKVTLQTPAEYCSEYGWGAKFGYRYSFAEEIFAGVDLSFSDFKFKDDDNSYLVISALAKYGFVMPFDPLYLDVDMGAGLSLMTYDSVTGVYPAFGVYMGLGYRINEKVEITAGGDLNVAWQHPESEELGSTDVALLCRLGARVNL